MNKLWIAPGLVLALLCIAASFRRGEPDPLGQRALCQAYSGVPAGFMEQPTAGMVLVRGGRFVPGSTQGYPEERPGAAVDVTDFYIDRTEVTNAQYATFVRATGYVTVAERQGAAPVFHRPTVEEMQRDDYAFWQLTRGVDRLHPDGAASVALPNQPVVQLAHEDALAYASWLGHSLPSEAQWELAARAGRSDEGLHKAPRSAEGRPLANFWQGSFPTDNSAEDGFEGRAPVGCYQANPFGLHDMVGNVWEWTAEPYHEHRDPAPQALAATPRVIKGGSFLCSPNFCARYRVSARHRQEPAMTGPHLGFRTVRAL